MGRLVWTLVRSNLRVEPAGAATLVDGIGQSGCCPRLLRNGDVRAGVARCLRETFDNGYNQVACGRFGLAGDACGVV